MKLATTTGDFKRFCSTYEERIAHIVAAGFRYIDLDLYTVTKDDALLGDTNWQDNAKQLLDYTHSLGAEFVQAHSVGFNPLEQDDFWQTGFDATVRSLEICQILGIPNTVVHAGHRRGISMEEFFLLNKAFYEKLFPYMEKTGVNVLTENSTAANMGDRAYINSGADTRMFVDYVNHPLFHACWDTGHANAEGSQYADILALGDHLRAVHINDNRGIQDEHIIPYLGTVNLDEVLHALQDAGFTGVFTFECNATLRSGKYWLGSRRPFPQDTRLLEPQCFMQDDLEKLLYHVGEYALKTYGCFEE